MNKHRKKLLKHRAREILRQRDAALPGPDAETAAHYDSVACIAGINAYLLALETLYEDEHTSATYRFDRIGDGGADPVGTLQQHLHPRYRLTFTDLHDWQAELTRGLPGWIFGASPLGPKARSNLVELLVVLITRALHDTSTAFKVDVETAGGPFYEAAAADYLFPTRTGIFLLHFGICD